MAKDGKHVIHAGGIFANPQLHREGAAAADTPPGTIGFFDNTTKKFTASVDGNEAAILYVANYDYLRCKTVDDVIKAGDWVVAFHPTPGVFFNVPAVAGTYTKGQPLSVANGRVKAVGTDESVRCYVEEDRSYTIATAGDLLRVVIK
ncbi:TPA: hypothetical protein U2Q83_004502 [Enterobacter hormaechei]|uniref:hypothetical protein n=1 Tax=Enterobacter cloacae complex TaxID=354276 RepID=UPI000650CE26|nr:MULTISPECIES: hypothetical protein [Enterobacter cloacae complex]EKY4103655.1 hypothetical protein [Enterobacter hormaechei subsp. steigerwaltii]EHN8810930.1 hypothetical protein [Enterobacter hormaechei]KLW24706.1 hypothetical protein SK50_03198 [Enterobacter sp. BWH64]MDK1415662.1 hypothetical protein [Enterobacter hormaechei]HEM8699526.1 hypothetical protein [Enterobacter hormaechei]